MLAGEQIVRPAAVDVEIFWSQSVFVRPSIILLLIGGLAAYPGDLPRTKPGFAVGMKVLVSAFVSLPVATFE